MKAKSKFYLAPIEGEITIDTFIKDYYNRGVAYINQMASGMSITENTDSQLFEDVEVLANNSLRLPHGLKVAPRFRLILNQSSGTYILDGERTDKYFEIINNTGVVFKGDILLLKG